MTRIYRMDDRPDAPSKAAIRCTPEEARAWNTAERGFGVFATVNDFGDNPRRKEHLAKICAWAVDMDDGTKAEMRAKLLAAPLIPSMIVETKRGYQAQWFARPGAEAAHWNAIVLERLVPAFGADRNARDLCRILRVPGYLHLKDPSDPFLVRVAWSHRVSYTERQMAAAWPWRCATADRVAEAQAEARKAVLAHPGASGGIPAGGEFWAAVGNLDCREGLERLSGSGYVNGERFTFRRVSSGNLNIFCDGRGTSCWIDASGKIGSLDKGGPFLSHWLRWYGNDWPTTIRALKEAFPHLVEADERDRAAFIEARRAERRRAA